MNVEEALALTDKALKPKGLTDLQAVILRESWQGKGYAEIAETTGYEVAYVKEVGSKLWRHLSKDLGQKVTKTNLQSVLRRCLQQQAQGMGDLPSSPTVVTALTKTQYQDWAEVVDVSQFYGRAQELALLEQWIVHDRCRLVTLLGMGGIGKTTLAAKLKNSVQSQFQYVLWRSLRNAPPFQQILTSLIKFLSQQPDSQLPESLDDQILHLLKCLQFSRCLIVLDNAESILQSGDFAGRYRSGYEGYGQLLRCLSETSHQSCLVLTSREKPIGLDAREGERQLVRCFNLRGLQGVEAHKLLQVRELFGSNTEKEKLIHCYGGNPLALKMVSTSIQALFDGDIAEFFKENITVFDGIRNLLDQQFQRLSALEKQIMFWLAINREPLQIKDLKADIVPQVARAKLLEALASLRMRSLIEKSSTGFTQQSVVMNYMTSQLIEQAYEAIATTDIHFFNHYALIKADSKDYVRASQIRLVLAPLVSKLQSNFKLEEIKSKLDQILFKLRDVFSTLPGYGGGNILNLLYQLKIDLVGYDFSYLTVWQAYLPTISLHQVNFTGANLAKSVFAETFGGVAFNPNG